MRKLIYIVGMVAILAAAFVFVQRATPLSNQPKITWSPANVYAGITSTTIVTKTIAFTSDQALQGVVLEAVPQIAGFVQIQPSTFAQVAAGQPQTVQLTFTAPAGAQLGAYDGTIHLRVGSSTLPQTLKASVTFAVVPLPPDPGDAGKATMAGVDSDGDGVRDDIERWIVLNYENSARIRAALYQEAVAIQQAILSSSNRPQAMAALNAEFGGRLCLAGLLNGGALPAGNLSDQLDSIALNTVARTTAYLTSNSFMSGTAGSLPSIASRTSLCAFNPNALPN